MGATPPRTAHEILDSAEYTLGLLDDLLDLSRIDEAKLHLNMGRTNARTLVSDAMQIVQPTADKAGIRLEVTGAGSDLYCRTDATRVRQILVNLLLNAVRHSPQNATVTVDVHGNGSELAFAVVDQGKGIERDELATIFDAYSTTDSPDAGGAGLVGRRSRRSSCQLVAGPQQLQRVLLKQRIIGVAEHASNLCDPLGSSKHVNVRCRHVVPHPFHHS